MPFPVYLLAPSAVLIVMVGIYSLMRATKKENTIFFFLCMSQALWAISSFLMWISCGNDIAVSFWDRSVYFATCLMVPFLYHLSLEICGLAERRVSKILVRLCYIIGIFFAYLTTTPYFVEGVFYYAYYGGCHTYARTGHHFFLIYVIAFLSFSFYNLYKTWRSEKQNQEKRDKAYFTLLGYSVFSLAGIGMITAYGIVVYPAYYIFFPLFSLIITYAITERNLFISSMATDILIGAILVLFSAFFFFPELQIGAIGKGSIFLLLLLSCSLLLKHNHEDIKRKEEAERVSKLKTEFISIVSHQLRTPLAAIRGYTDMIKDGDYGAAPKEMSVPLDYIHDASVSMIKMVNGLLSVTRLERGKVELKVASFPVEKMIEGCIQDVELKAKEKGLYVKYERPEQALPLLRGDEEKIKHAVMNILNNAILYTVTGGVTITTSVLYSSKIRIEIKDTGVGIDAEEQQKIFESFSRGKKGVEMYTQGTGLGLYVAKSFIAMHKGTVTVSSEGKDKGSTFYIDIPIKADIVSKQEFDLLPPDLKK
jgi:signal transduction histidine kinase